MLLLFSIEAFAQFNKDLDAINGIGVGTKYRDDLLWSSEAANVTPRHKGNVSVFWPSRYGLTRKVELSTSLAGDVFRPKIDVKYLFYENDTWYLAHKAGIATAYTGLKMAQNNGYDEIVDSLATVPLVGEVSYEFIASRVCRTDLNCSDGSPWLIITFSFANYVGIGLDGNDDLAQVRKHFLANRGETLVGSGYTGRLKIWVDALVKDWLFVRGGTLFYGGTFKKHFAFELHALGEAMITRRFSASAGVMLSVANYENVSSKVGVFPMVDLAFYIGKKARKQSTLFDPSGRKY